MYSVASGRRAGREPMLRSASSSTGVNARKNSTKSASSTSSRYALRERSASRSMIAVSTRLDVRCGEDRRRERRLEVAVGELGQPVFEGDRLPLLGQLQHSR